MTPFNLIVYSPSGHGKTYLAGSGVGDPRISPMLLLDFEAGVDSIESRVCPIANPHISDVNIINMDSYS